MRSTRLPSSNASEIAFDSATFALFAVFVAFLFLGYLGIYRSIPFSALGAVALFASLAVLFGANLRADRRSTGVADTPGV